MADEVLPDSRTRDRKSVVLVNGINYVPIYCINCGAPQGMVPDKLITHVTALCDEGCAGKYGDLASTIKDPDDVFREHLGLAIDEQCHSTGRVVTLTELEKMLDDPCPALAAVARDWARHVSKENE